MPTVKQVGERGPEMLHCEGIGVDGSNNLEMNKKKNLKAKRLLFEISMGRIDILKRRFYETKLRIMKQSQKTLSEL